MNGYTFDEDQFDKTNPTSIQQSVTQQNVGASVSHQNGSKMVTSCVEENNSYEGVQSQWQMMKAYLKRPKLLAFMGVLSYVRYLSNVVCGFR